METTQVNRRHHSSDSYSETDYSVRTFNTAERPMGKRRPSSTSGSDSSTKNCQLVNRQESICQFRCGRTFCSCKSHEVFSSPDREECSTRSRRKSSPPLSLNTSTVSRRSDEDSSPELRKREWLPSSSIHGENVSLGYMKTRRTRYDSSYSDVDTSIKKDVRANYRKEYVSPDQRFSLSENRKHISAQKKNEPTSIFKYDTEITSHKGHSSSGKERTRSVKHGKQANNDQHTTLRCNSSSPDIRLCTSYRNHNFSVLLNNEISVKTKHRKAETHSPSPTESSCYSSLEGLTTSSRDVEKKRYSRSNEKKHSRRSSNNTSYTSSRRNKRSHGSGMDGPSSAETSNYLSRSDRHSPVNRKMSRSDRHSPVNRKMSRSDRHSPVNRKMSRSDKHSPVNYKMSRSSKRSPNRYDKSNYKNVSQSKQRAQSPSLCETDYKRESGDSKRSLTNSSQRNYASPPDRRHLDKDSRDRRSNENLTPRRHGSDSNYKPKVNKRDSEYMKVNSAVKRRRSPDFPSSSSSSSEYDDHENAKRLRKRRRLKESESCDQTPSNRISMKTKVHSVAVMPKKSPQDKHTDRQDYHLQTNGHSSYHKQRSLRDNLLESCCQHSDEAWGNLKEQHDVDDSNGLTVNYGRKGASGTTSGRTVYSPLMATLQTPSGHHLKRSPHFSSPSFIANLSPRSTLKGLDQPHPWALDLVERSQTYRGTFVDSHCHIDLIYDRLFLSHETRFSDFRKMVAHSFPDNFEGCVAVFCYPKTYDPINPQNQLLTTLAHDDGVWFAIGCHPKSATEFIAGHEQGLRKALRQSKVVALGEIGLDYSGTFYRHAETQKMVLRKQLQMALEMKLPLVLHCRDAYDDCLAILMEMVPRNWPIHLHCFCGNPDTANVWLQTFTNLYIGLTPVITFRTAHDSINTARNIPLNRLLLETDSPYFVPGNITKGRSSVSHPGFALFTAERIAELKNVSVDTVLQTCRTNTYNVYGI